MKRQPYHTFPPDAVNHWRELIESDSVVNVLEFGGGGSTLWMDDLGAYVVCVEHAAKYANAIRRESSERVLVLHRPRPYNAATLALPGRSFDLVIVDGRDRVACTPEAMRLVRPGGSVMLDDSSRDRYATAHELLEQHGYDRLRYEYPKAGAPNGKRATDFYQRPEEFLMAEPPATYRTTSKARTD